MGAADADLGLGGLLDVLRQSGPVGAALAGVIVALTISVIVLARVRNLWDGVRDRSQGIDFQAKLLLTIDKLQASEDALRRRVDELGLIKATQQEQLDDLHVQLALLRHQRRRLIEMLRQTIARLPEPAVRVGGPRA